MGKSFLFSPGPVMVSDDVRSALMHYDICHRSAEFEEMYAALRGKITALFEANGSYDSFIVSGSGTSANETVLSSLFDPKEQILLVRNGVFGDRLLEIVNKYKIPLVDLAFEWASPPDISRIEAALIENPGITVVATVYHETSTGLINPIREIGELCEKYSKIFFVDCVSALAGEYVNLPDEKITIATSVGGKCVGAFPGTAYVCAKKDLLESIPVARGKTVYLNIGKLYNEARDKNQTPNTPNVNLLWGLDAAISNILSEGIENRIARYKRCAAILRKGLKGLGLNLLLDDKARMSNTVTSVFLPEGVDLSAFIRDMEGAGYTVYEGKGTYQAMGMFQVANMGEIYEGDCERFLTALSTVLDGRT